MHKRAAFAGLALVALVGTMTPAVATASESVIPPVPMGSRSSACAVVKGQFRSTVTQARTDKHDAYRVARVTWLAGTKDERSARKAALAAADTKAERKAALRTYHAGVTDERVVRKGAKAAARSTYHRTLKTAGKNLRHGMRTCNR